MTIDWSSVKPTRKPNKKELNRYQRWVKYLKDSKLTQEEIHKRAIRLTEQNRDPDY
jgi:hypothetical protein